MPTKHHAPNRHHCNALADLTPLVEQLGYQPSNASWEDSDHAYAFSIEANNATFGHPCVTIHLDKRTNWLTVSTP